MVYTDPEAPASAMTSVEQHQGAWTMPARDIKTGAIDALGFPVPVPKTLESTAGRPQKPCAPKHIKIKRIAYIWFVA